MNCRIEGPWDDVRRFENTMGNIFEEFCCGGEGHALLPTDEACLTPAVKAEDVAWEPYTDIQETEKEFVLTADIPGVEKKDIEINATEDGVEIKAETRLGEDEEKEGFVKRERSYRRFYRKYALPAAVDPAKAEAQYNNGVLEVKLSKKKVGKKGSTVEVK